MHIIKNKPWNLPESSATSEAVFVWLQVLPSVHGSAIGKLDLDDRLDGFEPVFPRNYKADWGTVLVREDLPIDAGREKT